MEPDHPHYPDPASHEPEHQAERKTRGPVRWLMYGLALVLLAGCIWFAIEGTRTETGESGFARLADADPLDAVWMGVFVAVQIVVNGLLFWGLTKPFGMTRPVGAGTMTALIAATSLLNYLPMRAGLIGRAAYLKQRHGIDYRVSLLMLLMAGGGTLGIFITVGMITLWRGQLDAIWWACTAASLIVGGAAALPAGRILIHFVPGVEADWFRTAGLIGAIGALALLALRLVDLLVGAGRLYFASQILGSPISYATALVLGIAGMFVTLATPLPNGLGLREGLYGLLARVGVGGALLTGPTGIAIGLVDRAVEAIVFVACGLIALGWLHRLGWRGGHEPQ